MTFQYGDRVQETFTTTGTGAISLAGAVVGYQVFSSTCANGDTCYYAATDGTNWEVGIGTFATSGDTLTRTTILSSSNGGAAVNWSAGTKNVWLTLPAAQVAQSFLGMRNRIINGGMAVDQRNAGASQTVSDVTAAYTVDRWEALSAGANVTGQRVAGMGADQFMYQFTGASSVTGINFYQKIESANTYDLVGQNISVSANLANSALTTVTWTLSYPTAQDNFTSLTQIATGAFTVNGTMGRYSAEIATLPTGVQNGLIIQFSVGAQVSGTWKIGGVQVEAGNTATPFERRPLSFELAQCQRYFQKSYNQSAVPGSTFTQGSGSFLLMGGAASTTNVSMTARFPVVMRTVPTVTTYDAAGASGKYSFFASSAWNNGGSSAVNTPFDSGVLLGATAGVVAVNMEYTASAEL